MNPYLCVVSALVLHAVPRRHVPRGRGHEGQVGVEGELGVDGVHGARGPVRAVAGRGEGGGGVPGAVRARQGEGGGEDLAAGAPEGIFYSTTSGLNIV